MPYIDFISPLHKKTKRDYLALNLSPEVLQGSRAIKRAFDPEDLLNPGKIFPDLPR